MSEYIFKLSMNNPETIENDGVTTVRMGMEIQERIVRCRDCKNYKPYRTNYHGMMNRCHDEHGHTHKRDDCDFCSRGERKER